MNIDFLTLSLNGLALILDVLHQPELIITGLLRAVMVGLSAFGIKHGIQGLLSSF